MDDPGSGKKLIVIAALVLFMGAFAMLGLVAALASTVALPYLVISKVEGWFKGGSSWIGHELSDFGNLVDPQSNKTIHDLLLEKLDCTNVSPQDRAAGWCIQPVYAEQQSPIPPNKLWLVPVWQAAAAKYNLPWELLAAVSAARTQFGSHDCPSSKDYPGDGFDRLSPSIWSTDKKAGLAVGHATLTDATDIGKGCKDSGEPVSMKKDEKTDVYDAVDSTFVTASALSRLQADKQWDYAEPADVTDDSTCALAKTDGYTYRYSNVVSGDGGYNQHLDIPQDIVQLGLRYTYATYGKQDFPATSGQIPGESDPRQVPSAVIDQLITATGQALGMRPKLIEEVRPALHKTMAAESAYRSAALQGLISGDPNNNYPDRARGLFQFTPGTFWNSRVPGFDNIFNPLHNLIAAMNIMYHGSGGNYTVPPLNLGKDGVWPQGGGWNPHFRNGNPYANLDPGNSTTTSTDTTTTASPSASTTPVKLDPQTDATSMAVAKMTGSKKLYSACYVATVHDWYVAIVSNPPLSGGAGGLAAAVQIAEQQLAMHVHEVPDGCNRGPQVDQYLLSVGIDAAAEGGPGGCANADLRPWCAAFVSWVMQKAGVAPVTEANVNEGKGSAAAIDFWKFGRDKNIIKPPTYAPNPGDLVLFWVSASGDSAQHIGLVVGRDNSTITTIEGNAGDAVSEEHYSRNPVVAVLSGISGFVALSDIYGSGSAVSAPVSSGSAQQPHIVQKLIPFGSKRKTETAAYAQKHYGTKTWHLNNPKVIVEHYTESSTMASAWNTFAPDVPDSELHELPGTCAHFIVDTVGTIYQVVPTTIICRHTVGLNYTAIGIEMVGMSDQEILGRPAQLDAVLKLTAWLQGKYGIQLRNVIGHNESLSSPYHKELYAPWRCQTHSDWKHADMQILRQKLKKIDKADGVSIGPSAGTYDDSCS